MGISIEALRAQRARLAAVDMSRLGALAPADGVSRQKVTSPGSSDSIELSGMATAVRQAGVSVSSARVHRVESLRASYLAGSYDTCAAVLSHSLISQSLNRGTREWA